MSLRRFSIASLAVSVVLVGAAAAVPQTASVRNGEIAFVRGAWIYVIGPGGGTPTKLVRGSNPAWSPDGTRIAFTSARFRTLEVCVMKADGGDFRRLTNTATMNYWPAWSPDGKRIAFTSNRDGNYEIYVMNADGSSPVNVTHHPAQDNYAAWSPDGKRLAFVSSRDGGSDVYVMDAP